MSAGEGSGAARVAALAARHGEGLHRLRDEAQALVFKCRRDAPGDFFAVEAAGLSALAAAEALRVPRVVAVGREGIVLEDLGHGRPSKGFWNEAGAGLAAQHSKHGLRFGFGQDGYCGPTPQSNAPHGDGHAFFADCRLRPQLSLAGSRGLLSSDERGRGERIAQRLPELLPTAPPVLLHGDLWLGNLHCCADGGPALIDAAAVHYGWAEAELAMLALFGEPPAAFFDAYAAAGMLDGQWRERAPLYNLYHLLNHLNLFGAAYHGRVAAVLRHYA